MDLEQRLNHLESHHDWQGLTEALEQGIVSAEDASVKADLHLRLGRLLHTRFLQGVKALKHFQDAYKLNPALVEALAEARRIYWELGKLNMVQKLLELQLKNTEDPAAVGALYRELGDVHCDLGDYERAADAYAHALSSADGEADAVGQLLEDVMVGTEDWQERIALLLRSAHQAANAAEKAECFLRAARIARRYAPEEVENILAQAYSSDPESVSAATLYEGLLVESDRTDAILERQREVLAAIEDATQRAEVAFRFGVRWALRHGNPELGAELFEQVVTLDPSREAAFNFLRDTYGAKGGDWERVVSSRRAPLGLGSRPTGHGLSARDGRHARVARDGRSHPRSGLLRATRGGRS